MKIEKTFKEKEDDKLYRLVFNHFCKNYDWYLVGTSNSKLVFMQTDYNNMNICFYLHGGKIHWSKKFFDNNVVKGWRLFEGGAWDFVNYSECVISRSDKFIFADREVVPYIRDIPK
jgi:hypothetical protein